MKSHVSDSDHLSCTPVSYIVSLEMPESARTFHTTHSEKGNRRHTSGQNSVPRKGDRIRRESVLKRNMITLKYIYRFSRRWLPMLEFCDMISCSLRDKHHFPEEHIMFFIFWVESFTYLLGQNLPFQPLK